LSGWLHRTTQNLAANLIRTDARRRAREQEAATMYELLSGGSGAAWENIAPQLDATLGELSDADRDALVLRYFERKSAREMAQILGTSEEAAQKRVTRAVDRLREIFAERGLTVGAASLGLLISANAVQSAPAGLAAAISTASSLIGTSLTAKTLAMTTLQKSLIALALAATAATGIHYSRQSARLLDQLQTVQQQQAVQAGQTETLRRERDDASRKLQVARKQADQLRRDVAELPALRDEVAQLRAQQQPAPQARPSAADAGDPQVQRFQAKVAHVEELSQYLQQMPNKNIPEIRFLTDDDWLAAAKEAKFDSDADIRKALSDLRSLAKSKMPMGAALYSFTRANQGRLPTDLSQLKPYFKTPVTGGSKSSWPGVDPVRDGAVLDTILQRYTLLYTGNSSNLDPKTWVVVETAPVDRDYDSRAKFGIGFSTVVDTGIGSSRTGEDRLY
jgi:hypothetical protein